MSSIPPNIMGSILQAQLSAVETAKKKDAHKNKRSLDARQMSRLADRHRYEVEHASHTENVIVHPQQDKQRDGQDNRDIYDHHAQNVSEELYSQESSQSDEEKSIPSDNVPKSDSNTSSDSENINHIDFSA